MISTFEIILGEKTGKVGFGWVINEEGGGLVLAGEGINGDVRVGDKVEEGGDKLQGFRGRLGTVNSNQGEGVDLVLTGVFLFKMGVGWGRVMGQG